MSLTKYPKEAENFKNSANGLVNNIQETITGLNDVNEILSLCDSKDLIVSRSSESITGVINRINKMGEAILTDIDLVKRIANDLENEEKLRQLELNIQEEEMGNVNEQS